MNNESRKWLYDNLNAAGYNVGKNYEEFDSLLTNNEESRRWAYDTANSLGYNVGKDYAEFSDIIAPKAEDITPTTKGGENGYTLTADELNLGKEEPKKKSRVRQKWEARNDDDKEEEDDSGAIINPLTPEQVDEVAQQVRVKLGITPDVKKNATPNLDYGRKVADIYAPTEKEEQDAIPAANKTLSKQLAKEMTTDAAHDRLLQQGREDPVRVLGGSVTSELMSDYSKKRAGRKDQVEKDVERNANVARVVANPYSHSVDPYNQVAFKSGATKLRNADELGMIEEFAKDAKNRILTDETLKAEVQKEADLLEMSLEDYVDKIAVPALQQRMYEEWIAPQEEKAKENYNGVMAAAEGSLIGMLLGATRTDTEKYLSQVGQEAWRKDASILDRALSGAGSMFLDLPIFGGFGSLASVPTKYVGGQVFKHMAKNEAKKVIARGASEVAAQRYANYAVTNGLKNRILLNLSTSPLQSGLTFGMFDAGKAALNMSLNGEWSWGELGKSASGGFLLGAALGGTNAVGGALTHGLTGATNAGAKVAEFAVENAVFTEGGRLIGKLHGQQPENGWWEDYLESGATLLMLKAPSIVKNVSAIKGDKEASEVFAFNELEREQLGRYGEDLNAVLESLLPRGEKMTIEGKGVSLDGIDSGVLSEEYMRVMSDPEISMTTKAKLMGIVEGKVMPAPRVVDAQIEGNKVMTYDPMGRLVEVKEYRNEAAAKKEMARLAPIMEKNGVGVLEDMYIRIKGYEADDSTVREWLAKNHNVTAEDIAVIVAKDNAKDPSNPLTKAEQKILDSLREARREGLNDVAHLNEVLTALEAVGINAKDIVSGIEKPFSERTEAEQRAVNAYRNALVQEVYPYFEPYRAKGAEGGTEANGNVNSAFREIYSTSFAEEMSPIEADKAYRAYQTATAKADKALGLNGKSVEEWMNGRSIAEAADGNAKVAEVLTEYFSTKMDFEGRRDRFIQDRDRAYSESDMLVDEYSNNGMIYTTKIDGQDVYITGGNIVYEDGGINWSASDEVLYVRMPDGKVIPVAKEKFRNEIISESAENVKAAKRAEVDAKYKAEFDAAEAAAAENGRKPIEVGAEYEVVFDGDVFRVKVEGRDENGDVIISSEGASMAVPEGFLQDAMKQAEVLKAESGKALQTENGEVKTENQIEVAPVVTTATTEMQTVPVAQAETVQPAPKAAFEQNIPVDEKGKKMWEQSTPEYVAEYIRVRKPEDVEAQMSVVSGMIEGLEKQKSKMDAMDAMDIDDKIAFWNKVGELIGGAKEVEDPIAVLNAKHSSALTAFNSMLEGIRGERNKQKAAVRYEGLENMIAELGKQLPEGYTIGVVNGKYAIVETTPRVQPVEENNESTISQASEQVIDHYTLNSAGNSTQMLKDMEAVRKSNREEYGKISPAYELFYKAKERGLYPNELEELRAIVKGTSLESKVDGWFTPVMAEGGNAPGNVGVYADNQGNPVDADGKLVVDEVNSIGEITDEDFENPTRNVQLPAIPENVANAIGTEGRPVVIKKNVFTKNSETHVELEPEDSRNILSSALYNPNLVGSTQPIKRPDYKVAIRTGEKNAVVVLDVYREKDYVEIVGWRLVNEKGLAKMQRQAEREGGQFLILSPNDGSAAALSALPLGSSSASEGTTQSAKVQENSVKSEETAENGGEAPVTSETTEQPETGEVADAGPVNRETLQLNMSDEDFNALLSSGDKAAISEYLAEMDGLLRIGVDSPLDGRDAIVKEYRGLVEQYGGEENIPADVVAGINERIAPYNALQRVVFDRKYALQDKLREIEANEAQAKEQAEKEAKAEHKQTAFGGFLASKTDLGASAAEKALNKKYNFDGKVMTVAEFVEEAVANGNAKLSTIEEPKYKGASRAAWNRMDARQQEADAKRVKESGTKTVYTVNDHDFGKTAYDYAKFLLDKKAEQEKADAKQKVKDAIEPFAKEKAAEQATIKIEDVGEKIGGARKDIIRQYADKIKLDGKTFSTMFPKPDIDKLVEAGLPKDKVAAVKAMYDNAKREFEITKKRRGKDKALQASLFYAMYAKNVLTGEEGNFDLAYNGFVFTEWGKEFMKANIALYKAVFDKLGADYGKVDLRSYFITPLVGDTKKRFNLKKLNEENSRMQQRMAEMDGRKVPEYKDGDVINFVGEHYSRPSDQFETLEEAVNTMVERISKEVKVDEANQYKVEAYWKRDAQGRADYSKAYLGIKVRGFGTVDVMEFKNMNEARAWLQDHKEDFQQMAAAKEEQVKAENKKPLPKYVIGNSYDSAKSQYSVFADFGKEGVRVLKTFDIPQTEGLAAQAKARSEVYKNDVLPYMNSEEALSLANGFAQEIRDAKSTKQKPVTVEKKSRERVGVDWRDGKNATPDMFVDIEGNEPSVFGFRAVEFGNYVTQKERQQYLNDLYDALMDMSELLGVSPRALSLGGKLALAVGARGTSGASGHYEPYKNVINITKTSGAGVLAHEWLHAFDRYFSNFDENAVYPNGVMYATQGMFADDTRREVKEAFDKVMTAIKGSDYEKRSMRLGEYWASDKELAARALQDYIIRKLDARGQKNDFLSNHVTPEEWDGDAKGYPFPLGEEVQKIGDAFDNLFATLEEKTTDDGKVVLYNIADEMQMLQDKGAEAFERATKVTMDAVERLKANGLDIEVVSQEEADAMAELAEMQKRTAPETVSVQDEHLQTVVSSADGAKVLKDLDNAINEYEKDIKTKEKTFLGRLAEVLNAKKHGSNSQYATFEAVNGKVFTIRLANHNAKVSTFDNHDENEGISIVVTAQDNNGVTNDGNAHLVEFFYDAIKLRKADGKPLVEILKSIKQALYSGEYKDNTGLAVREEVNIPEMMTVFHGSGAKFDKFDHSFMNTGEGAQAFGWGIYVTEIEGIGKQYARTSSKIEWLKSDLNRALERLPFTRGDVRIETEEFIAETRRKLEELGTGRHLYTVEIPDDNGSNYLHWDKPINGEIQERIANGLQSIGFEIEPDMNHLAYSRDGKIAVLNINAKGKDLYAELSEVLGGDKQASLFLSDMGFVGISYPAEATTGGRADGARNYVIFNENDAHIKDRVEFLRTANGKVYGWAVDGKIRLTPDGINPNTPVHEYAHLWGADVEKNNPKLWNEVVEAMKLSPVWNEVANDANYSNIHGNDSRMSSEVLARLSGRENYRRTIEEAEKEIAAERDIVGKVQKKGILNRIKNALKNFWNWVQRNVFRSGKRKGESGQRSAEVMPWEEFANSVIGDFYKGKNPNVKEGPLEKMFLGEKGAENLDKAEEATIRLDNLSVAREMETAGKDAKTIKLATGWERGADGKWRYETEDVKLNRAAELFSLENHQSYPIAESLDKGRVDFNGTIKLADLVNDEELLKAYPEMEEYFVSFEKMDADTKGLHDFANQMIRINKDDISELESTLVHEIQHAIQSAEGFAMGGSTETIDVIKDKARVWAWRNALKETEKEHPELAGTTELEKVLMDEYRTEGLEEYIPTEEQRIKGFNLYARGYDGEGYERAFYAMPNVVAGNGFATYRRLAGEVESRNVQERMGMSPEERRNKLAEETEDVRREDQIFMYDALGSASEERNMSNDLTDGPVRGHNEPEWKFKARREKWRRWVESNTNVKTPMPEKPFLQEGEPIEVYEERMKEFNEALNKWKKEILSKDSEIEEMMNILYDGKIPEKNPTPEDEFTEQVFKRYMGDDGIKVDRKSMRGMIMDEIIERRRKIETNNFDDVVFINEVRKATTAEQRKAIPFIIEGTYNGEVSKELRVVVQRIKDWFENVYQAMQAADAMHSSGKIKNYVTHIWDKERTPKAVYENYINTRSKYTNRRSIDTYAEGIALGMVPKYDDICDIMLEYGHIANEAIANKDFTDFLHMLRVDGEPVLKDASKRDPMYVRTSAEALDGYKVHKYAKGIVENVLGSIRTENAAGWMQKLAHSYDVTGSLMKKINLSLSFFHHGALLETAVGAMNPAKAISTVFKNLVWDCMRSGELPALSNPEVTRNAVNHLVQLGATQDYMAKEVNRLTGRLKEMLKDFSDKHPNIVTKAAVAPAELLDFLNTGFDKVLWDYLHDGLKIYTFDKYAKEIEEYAQKKGLDSTDKDMLLNEAGQLVNDIYGGQFWELVDMSPATVKWLRRLLLSPDWTISTIRQALSPIGFGTLYKDYEKNWAQRTVGTGLSASFRRKQGVKFWITALLTFGALMNGLNAWRRKEDVDDELEKAEERRKTDPEYKSPYELKYPEGMKWYDYTMAGNTIGHQTHLFGWRYDDGKEGYIRWGKQFRELPELFLGREGFSFPGPMIDKLVGKANPALSAGLAFLGYAKDGWQSKWMKNKKGWDKDLGRVMMMAAAFMPYSIPTDEDKEFVLTDLIMPSSKGYSRYKAIRDFETAILSQDMDFVGAVYDACVMNKLDAEKLLEAAILRVEASAKAEYVEGVETLNDAFVKYGEDLDIDEKRAVRAKFNKLLQENAYKDFEKQEAADMVAEVLNGTYREEKLPDAYIANELPEDVRDAYKVDAIRLRLKKIVDDTPKEMRAANIYKNENQAKIDLYKYIVAANREIGKIMSVINIDPTHADKHMEEIRKIRESIINTANNLQK